MSGETSPDVTRKLANLMGEEPGVPAVQYVPSYRVIGDAKIPVSKNLGPVWQSRVDAGTSAMKTFVERWEQVEKYFYNDQQRHRQDREDSAGNYSVGIQNTKRWSETENVLYSNFMAMVPALFAKNPSVEITSTSTKEEAVQDAVRAGEMLCNAISAKKAAPGVNLKSKGRRGILHGLAFNEAWLFTGYVNKEDSSDAALADLEKLSAEYAKDDNLAPVLMEIEGQLMALEEASDFFAPAGPDMKLLDPKCVVIDPNSTEDDLSDAKWLDIKVFFHTGYLKAKYFTKDAEGTEWASIFEPTHILQADQDEKNQNVRPTDNLYKQLLDSNKSSADYGFKDEAAFRRAQYTECHQVWDRITKRVYLFHCKNWKWPIWVWDDPYGYDGFFPVDKLALTSDLRFNRGRGEATYYLDQQDGINEINSELQHTRMRMRGKLFYNTKYIKDQKTLDNYLNSDTLNAFGLDLPEGVKLDEAIFGPNAPSLQIKELYNKEHYYQAIDRIGNYSAVMRGNEFKTNTTNDAVETYNSISTQKIDEKIDAVEEWIGAALEKVLHCCVRFMSDEQVQTLIGVERMEAWGAFKDLYNNKAITMRVIGGSTQKPTSAAKKKEALQIGQILGQYASATPMSLIMALKLMEQAFDEIDITQEDWRELRESIMMQLQRGNSQGGPGDNTGGEAEAQPADADIEKMVQAAVQRGVPEKIAREKIQAKVRQEPTQ